MSPAKLPRRGSLGVFCMASVALLVVAIEACAPSPAPREAGAQDFEWVCQFGTPSIDYAMAISVDAAGVYVAGSSRGTLPGQTSAGRDDAFVRKYDADGKELWTRQFGTASDDLALAISVAASGVYVAGWTEGTLPGQTSAGSRDAFVRKYDADGKEVWTRQFGTASEDLAREITVAASGVYVAGWTFGTLPGQTSAGRDDAFVRKYDADGNEVWTRQFGTSSGDRSWAISAAAAGVYVAGGTEGTLLGQTSAGREDAFLRKYDADGNEVWTRQFGTASDEGISASSADASGVYVAASTSGTLPGQASAGDDDTFVRKYDADGNELWTRQFGTSGYDHAFAISVAASAVYVAGRTVGTFPGFMFARGLYAYLRRRMSDDRDAFVSKYDANGNQGWTHQFGTPSDDLPWAVSADITGVYVAGETAGALPGQTSAGGTDAFVGKLVASTTAKGIR